MAVQIGEPRRRPRAHRGRPPDPGRVVDTGVDDVPDLAGKIDGLYDVTAHGTQLSASTAGNDDYGHGTAVASLIAGNGFGMAGFGGAAHVIGIHADNQGRFYDFDLAQAIAKLDALGVRIVNLSIGGPVPSSPILVDAIDKAASDGMLIVAASGNESGPVDWPAALPPAQRRRRKLRTRGRRDERERQAESSFSNFGEHLSLVAPGIFTGDCSGVLVALPPQSRLLSDACYRQWTGSGGAEYGYVAGTSFASPEVAGVAALVWAARPELKNYHLADIIKASADRDAGTGWTPTMGCGRLDAAAAVTLALRRTAAEWASGPPPAAGPCPLRRQRCAAGLASHPDDHVQPHPGPNDRGRRLQPERTRVLRPVGHIHRPRRLHHASRHCPRVRRQPVLDHRIPERQRPHLRGSACVAGRCDHRRCDAGCLAGQGHRRRARPPALPLDNARNRRDGHRRRPKRKGDRPRAQERLRRRPGGPLLRRVARTTRGDAQISPILRHAPQPHARRARTQLHRAAHTSNSSHAHGDTGECRSESTQKKPKGPLKAAEPGAQSACNTAITR